jgi:hypothetical protein
MRTQAECDGVGPSKMKSWCHPGGLTYAFGGAVMVQVFPEHENAGKRILPPLMTFPCVLDEAIFHSQKLIHPQSLALLTRHE